MPATLLMLPYRKRVATRLPLIVPMLDCFLDTLQQDVFKSISLTQDQDIPTVPRHWQCKCSPRRLPHGRVILISPIPTLHHSTWKQSSIPLAQAGWVLLLILRTHPLRITRHAQRFPTQTHAPYLFGTWDQPLEHHWCLWFVSKSKRKSEGSKKCVASLLIFGKLTMHGTFAS